MLLLTYLHSRIAIDVTVSWFVCPTVCISRSCKQLKCQNESTGFLLHTIAACRSQIVLKI